MAMPCGCDFSCWMAASDCAFRRSKSACGNVAFSSTSLNSSSESGSLFVIAFRLMNDVSSEEPAPRRAPSISARSAISQRAALLRAFVEHVEREPRGAGRGETIRRVARVDDQRHVDDRRVVPLGERDLQAIRQREPLRAAAASAPAACPCRQLAAIRAGGRHVVFGRRLHVDARTRHPTATASQRPGCPSRVASCAHFRRVL